MLKALAGEFVADAVNVEGGRVAEEVALWLDLARKLGLVAAEMLDSACDTIEVEARGELSHEQVDALGLSAMRGVFSRIVDEPVTFVNAPRIAEERGVTLKVSTAPESATHRSVLEVKAISASGQVVSVIGALTGLERIEKIVRINGRGLDMRAEGRNLFLHYSDVPGMLGKVGTMLGASDININAAALSQDSDGEKATLILRVDKEVPEALLEDIRTDLGAVAFQLDLD